MLMKNRMTPAAYIMKLFISARMTNDRALMIRPMMQTTFAPIFLPRAPNATMPISESQPPSVTMNDMSVCCQPYISVKMPNSVLAPLFQKL